MGNVVRFVGCLYCLLSDSPPQQEQHVSEPNSSLPEEEEEASVEEVSNPSDNGEGSVVEEEEPVGEVIDEAPNSLQAVISDAAAATVQEEAPKKSYASIVGVWFERYSDFYSFCTTFEKSFDSFVNDWTNTTGIYIYIILYIYI